MHEFGIYESRNYNYRTLASKLSQIVKARVEPSQLERFAEPQGSEDGHVEIVPGVLSGCSGRYAREVANAGSPMVFVDRYFAQFLLTLPSGRRILVDSESDVRKKSPRSVVRYALELLIHNAEKVVIESATPYSEKVLPFRKASAKSP
ncbi:MAG: hypothetical protein Q8R04_05795 [Nanoarchaeota archaeon]|nr:hypothetical protein [Nanoarchaeota archaeon]